MTQTRFFTLLTATSVGVSLASWLLQSLSATFQRYNGVVWFSLALFIPLSICMFFVGKRASTSANKSLFHSLIMPFTFIKMLSAVIVLLIYKKVFHPETKYFLLPFFLVYFVFTIFETYFMIKIAKQKDE